MVVALAKQHEWRFGAELGLSRGLLLRRLLATCPKLHMVGVDLCRHPHRAKSLEEIEETFGKRVTVLRGSTVDMAPHVTHELDFVFIDAGHGYEAVKADIALWAPKVRKYGWVMGHDYDPHRHPGVVQAVDEAFDDDVEILPFTIWVRGGKYIAPAFLENIRKAFD